MKFASSALAFAAALLAGCSALTGTWIETEQAGNSPRVVRHFGGKTLRFENLFGDSDTVPYQVKKRDSTGTTISVEYTHMVKKPGGRMVKREEYREFLLHTENGRPILSEKDFEADGRGDIIMSEYLREEDFIDGFSSELKRKLNDRPVPAMMQR